jgi:hypothetical protein
VSLEEKNRLVVIKMSNKLVCSICGSERSVPTCCDKSMMVKDDYLLCCCLEECGYQPVPECCGKKMDYVEY